MENIQKSLAWAGLQYDYGMLVSLVFPGFLSYSWALKSKIFVPGPGVGGPHGPYFQVGGW